MWGKKSYLSRVLLCNMRELNIFSEFLFVCFFGCFIFGFGFVFFSSNNFDFCLKGYLLKLLVQKDEAREGLNTGGPFCQSCSLCRLYRDKNRHAEPGSQFENISFTLRFGQNLITLKEMQGR